MLLQKRDIDRYIYKKVGGNKMKITVPVNEKSLEGSVCQAFARAPYFLFFDTDTNERVFMKNDAADSQGGAGPKAAQFVVDQKTDALLVPRCGEKAADVLEAAHIDIFKVKDFSVIENIEAHIAGKLSVLDEIHPGFHNHGK